MAFTLKNYQRNALAALEDFFNRARGSHDAASLTRAFDAARAAAIGDDAGSRVYRPFAAGQPDVPQVCIRIPTGGGKTLLAAHAVQTIASAYVGAAYPVVLWLVPTNTIRTQTLDALRKPGHPYRQALEQHYPSDRLVIIDIQDCEQLRPEDFGQRTIVVVGTIQTLRVGNTASRDVYAYKEAFEPHFAKLPWPDFFETVQQADLDAQPYLKFSDLGKVKFSFANLLAWHRPIVIVDEAHNARTDLSAETLGRVRPACIIEWTATPAHDQNVVFTVSANELKAEHMVKLPIVLSPHGRWQDAVRDAVLTRERLAGEAANERDYVRPIVLFQAEPQNGEVKVEVLKSYLLDELHIADRRIAVATGSQRELDGIDLFDRACPIDFVVTIEALKEGWDCSFAYVFCTVQRIRSATDMEQLLGRVLRLPYASPRRSEALNRAYAHVSAMATLEVASQLADRLISMGFEQYEAATSIESGADDWFGSGAPSISVARTVETVMDVPSGVADALLAGAPETSVRPTAGTEFTATLTGILPPTAIESAVAAAPARQRSGLERALRLHQARALQAASPQQRGMRIGALPRLFVPVQGELVLLESGALGDLAEFSLVGCDAEVGPFALENDPQAYLIDVEGERLKIGMERIAEQLDLNLAGELFRREDVIRALDRKLRRPDILQPDMIGWLGRAIDMLLATGIELAYLARHLNRLADVLKAKIAALAAAASERVFQTTMFGPAPTVRLDATQPFSFGRDYPARFRYDGRYVFRKHFYGPPGELKSALDAEETACAVVLDGMPEVNVWVRNLERQPDYSFWLPTATDRFYPDFVAELTDGRMLVVEYKGADRYSNDDSREKRAIGEVWASLSGGRCRFVMVTDPSLAGRALADQIRATLQ
jgi:type III restriction enzyme